MTREPKLYGKMIGMARLNLPAIFVYGGTMMPGNWDGKQVTDQDVFEAVGTYESGNLSLEQLTSLENVACPSAAHVLECILPTLWLQ